MAHSSTEMTELVRVRREEHILGEVLILSESPDEKLYNKKRKRGQPKTRWKDADQRDIKSTGLTAGEEMDRVERSCHTDDPI